MSLDHSECTAGCSFATLPTQGVFTGARCIAQLHCSFICCIPQVALHIAAVNNDHRITKMLIQSGARLNRPFASGVFFASTAIGYGGTVLGFACVNSDFVLFEMLVNAGKPHE